MPTRRTLALVLAAVAPGGAPAAAPAATPPPEWPVIDQYVEMIPTAVGPSSPRGEEERQPLPAGVGREIQEQAGADANALTEIATSSRYGAPQRQAPASEAPAPEPARTGESLPADERPAAEVLEAGDAATIPGDARLVVLMVAMAASVIALGAYELARRRRGS